jgi:hypothetical protein
LGVVLTLVGCLDEEAKNESEVGSYTSLGRPVKGLEAGEYFSRHSGAVNSGAGLSFWV